MRKLQACWIAFRRSIVIVASPPSDKTDRPVYSAFGLRIASDLELPELPFVEADAGLPPDVEIRVGAVDPELPGTQEIEPGVHARPGALLLDYPEARYLIRGGREIVVQPAPDIQARDVRVYLLGSAMGAIFHQRGLLPLHANAIEVDGKAVAFAGASGAGKSTLAAHFYQRGYRVLCDDVCVVTFDDAGRPLAWPGIPRIKLWDDALAALGRDSSGLERVWGGAEKFSLPTPTEFAMRPLPLSRVYILADIHDDVTGFSQLCGVEAANVVIGNIYRWEFTAALGVSNVQFANAMTLLRSARAYSSPRASGLEVLGSHIGDLELHFSS